MTICFAFKDGKEIGCLDVTKEGVLIIRGSELKEVYKLRAKELGPQMRIECNVGAKGKSMFFKLTPPLQTDEETLARVIMVLGRHGIVVST